MTSKQTEGRGRESWLPGTADAHPWRLALLLLVVPVMLVVAQVAGTSNVIFPESAALSFGILIMATPTWRSGRWRHLVSISASAFLGFGLQAVHLPVLGAELVALTAVLFVLTLLRSEMFPSISAALLPIVFHVQSIVYPISVTTILVVVLLLDAITARGAPARTNERHPLEPSLTVTFWLAAVTWLVIGAFLHVPAPALAPPLFVSTMDLIFHPTTWRTLGTRWLIFAVAAATTAVTLVATDSVLIAGMAGYVLALGLVVILRTPYPPALAMGIVPLIVVRSQLDLVAPLLVVGAVVLCGLAWLYGHVMVRLWSKAAALSDL